MIFDKKTSIIALTCFSTTGIFFGGTAALLQQIKPHQQSLNTDSVLNLVPVSQKGEVREVGTEIIPPPPQEKSLPDQDSQSNDQNTEIVPQPPKPQEQPKDDSNPPVAYLEVTPKEGMRIRTEGYVNPANVLGVFTNGTVLTLKGGSKAVVDRSGCQGVLGLGDDKWVSVIGETKHLYADNDPNAANQLFVSVDNGLFKHRYNTQHSSGWMNTCGLKPYKEESQQVNVKYSQLKLKEVKAIPARW